MTSRRWRVAAVLAPLAVATVALAAPAAQAAPRDAVTLQCASDFNGGTMVNGVCVLPDTPVNEGYENFIATSNFTSGSFLIVAGSLPPGLTMPEVFGVTGTIITGTTTTTGTYNFTVHANAFLNGVKEDVPDLPFSLTVTG